MKNWRDWQSIAYLFALPALVIWAWLLPSLSVAIYLAILTLVVGVCCISHNHTHLPIWRAKWLNRMTDMWIGVLQGHPVYMFQPAHIESHHRHNQGKEDITRVLRYTSGNNILGYLIFPFQVLPALRGLKRCYLKKLWREERSFFWWVILLHIPLYGLWIFVLVANPYKALVLVFIPQIVGLHFLLASNYLQHAHAVAGSRYNHSRNFVGWINLIWLNVGYHTAHHDQQDLHWTGLPSRHEAISRHIDPRLNEASLIKYTLGRLMLGMAMKRFRSSPLQSSE